MVAVGVHLDRAPEILLRIVVLGTLVVGLAFVREREDAFFRQQGSFWRVNSEAVVSCCNLDNDPDDEGTCFKVHLV